MMSAQCCDIQSKRFRLWTGSWLCLYRGLTGAGGGWVVGSSYRARALPPSGALDAGHRLSDQLEVAESSFVAWLEAELVHRAGYLCGEQGRVPAGPRNIATRTPSDEHQPAT